ncbi:DUF4157 domain-containing protein [Sorangium sp. So ce269]
MFRPLDPGEKGRPPAHRGEPGAKARAASGTEQAPAHAEQAPAHAAAPERLAAQLGPGEALDGSVRAKMERGLGQDLSTVRIHRDADAARLADAHDAAAFTVGEHVVMGRDQYAPHTLSGQAMLAHELAHALQQRGAEGPGHDGGAGAEREADRAAAGALLGKPQPVTKGGGLRLQRCSRRREEQQQPQQATGERLVGAFGGSFPASAAQVRANPSAMALVRDAEAGGATFGGFSEDGPGGRAWAYTVGATVYVPRAFVSDPARAANAFLFELTNAASRSRHAEVNQRAAAHAITAEQYAHDTTAIEVDGTMRIAEIWAAERESVTDPAERARRDAMNYYTAYQDVRSGRRTREDIIQDVLNRTYPDSGLTVRQTYIDQYNRTWGARSP